MGDRRYEVVVGNIGYVYYGGSRKEADRAFLEYRRMSKNGYGRAAGEPVALFVDGEPEREHEPEQHEREPKQPQGQTVP